MAKSFIQSSCQRGYSLLELSFALLFAATLIGATTYTFVNISEQNRTASFVAQHNQLIGKLSAYFAENPAGIAVSDDNGISRLYDRGVIPQSISLIVGSTPNSATLQMATGTIAKIRVTPTPPATSTNPPFWGIQYKDISKTACMAVLGGAIGVNNTNQVSYGKVYKIVTNGASFYPPTQTGKIYTLQDIGSSCSLSKNAITFSYKF